MIEDIINIFKETNYDLFGGGSTINKNKNKNKTLFAHTKYMVYDMYEDDDNTNSNSENTNKETNKETNKGKHSRVEQPIVEQPNAVQHKDKLMKTLLIPLPTSNTITVGIFIKAGSQNETKSYGIAHFLEHMTFKGTTKTSSDDLMLKLDSIGANYNAMTGHEFTAYYISGNPLDIDFILETIIDLYLYPTFPEQDIETERNVVMEEQRMNEDSSNRYLTNTIFAEIYRSNKPAIARPIIGYPDTISKFTRKDIIDFRDKNYMGSNCLLCVSGNFAKNKVICHIQKKFYSILQERETDDQLFFSNVEQNFVIDRVLISNASIKRHININKEIKQTVINFVFSCVNANNKYKTHFDLLGDILSNGFSSRLFNLLRNKMGVSYYNNSFIRTFENCGQFVISVGVDHKSIIDTITGIINELKNIKKNGVTIEELTKVKKQNETSLLFQFKDPHEYLMHYGLNYLQSKPMYNITDMLNDINSVTLDELNYAIGQLFVYNNVVIGTIGKCSDQYGEQIIRLIQTL